jgi:lysozyme family protein
MSTVCDTIVSRILAREGGPTNDPVDRGGLTRWGQTDAWLALYKLPPPTTLAQAAANYLTWLSLTKLDLVCTADDALSDVLVDAAVNAGEFGAIRALQRSIGTTPDGVIGPETVSALQHFKRDLVAVDVWRAHGDVCIATVLSDARLQSLVQTTQLRFLRGWWNRLAAQVTRL